MKRFSWIHIVLTVAMVLAGGVALVLADGGLETSQRLTVNVNGDVESFGLDDLVDGEIREFDAGEHTITVTRTGDELSVLLDGESVVGGDHMVWVTEDELHGADAGLAERVVIVKRPGGGDGDLRTIMVHAECDPDADDCEELDVDIEALDDVDILAGEGHSHPMIVTRRALRGGLVRYRCEETGSELLVKKDDAVADSYICPATGCLMERVEKPEIKVISIRHEVESDAGIDQ